MLYYDNDREHKEAVWAECRRLERFGYGIVSVEYGNVDSLRKSFFPIPPFNPYYGVAPKIIYK